MLVFFRNAHSICKGKMEWRLGFAKMRKKEKDGQSKYGKKNDSY